MSRSFSVSVGRGRVCRTMVAASALVALASAGGPPAGAVPQSSAPAAPGGSVTYTVGVLHSGKCAGPVDGAEYALIVQQPCDGRASQRVTLVPARGYRPNTYLFRMDTGKCWEVHNNDKDPYTAIVQRTCSSGSSQWFDLHDNYHPWGGTVIRTNTGGYTDRDRWRVIHVQGASTADGAQLIQYTPGNWHGTGAKNDTFLFNPAPAT